MVATSQPKREYKEDDGAMPIVTEPHDSDYEFIEEEEKGNKGSRAGSIISSVAVGRLKTMIKDGLNHLLSAFFCIHIFSTTIANMTTAKVDAENLPTGNLTWKMLLDFFMEQGVQITGWPETVLFPTQRLKPDAAQKSGQGIKDIGINSTRLLAERLDNRGSSMAAVKVDINGTCSH